MSNEKPSSPYFVMLYFWWGCRGNLTLIRLKGWIRPQSYLKFSASSTKLVSSYCISMDYLESFLSSPPPPPESSCLSWTLQITKPFNGGLPYCNLHSNLALLNLVNSKSPLFESQAESPLFLPSFDSKSCYFNFFSCSMGLRNRKVWL